MSDTSLPQVRSFPWLRGYQGHFKKPGGSWQFVCNPDGSAKVFPTSEAAKDAATQIVFRFMCPEIVAERPVEPASEPQGIEVACTAEAIAMRASKAEEARMLRQQIDRSFRYKAGERRLEVVKKKAKRA